MLYVGRGVRNLEVVDQALAANAYGVPTGPAYADLATLRGDPSDGLPGVPGVGEKTAAGLLSKFDGLAAVRAAAEARDPRIAPGLAAKLEAPRTISPPRAWWSTWCAMRPSRICRTSCRASRPTWTPLSRARRPLGRALQRQPGPGRPQHRACRRARASSADAHPRPRGQCELAVLVLTRFQEEATTPRRSRSTASGRRRGRRRRGVGDLAEQVDELLAPADEVARRPGRRRAAPRPATGPDAQRYAAQAKPGSGSRGDRSRWSRSRVLQRRPDPHHLAAARPRPGRPAAGARPASSRRDS